MKTGVVASTVLHVVVLGWGAWSLGSPEPLDMTNSESMPVELVPLSELSETVRGDDEAELGVTPSPKPTEEPQKLPMPADNVGDNEVDLDAEPTDIDQQRATQQAAAAAPAPPPPPPQPEAAEPEPAPEPEPETAEPAPAPEAEAEAIAAAEPEEPQPSLPQQGPTPSARPDAPQRVAAAQPDEPVRQPERPREEPQPEVDPIEQAIREQQEAIQASEEERFDADEIAALLNRERSAGGGARRSETPAAFGGSQTTGATLSQTDIDLLRGQIQRCWSPPAGVQQAGSLTVSIHMQLGPNGELQAAPQLVRGGGGTMAERAAGDAALRAVQRCAPYDLPQEKYELWSNIIVNFDPSQMF